MPAASEPKTVAESYFACMRAGDVAVVDLFHEDAVLRGLGFRKQGREQIREFYAGAIAGARPSPSPASQLLVAATACSPRSPSRWPTARVCTPSMCSTSRRGASVR